MTEQVKHTQTHSKGNTRYMQSAETKALSHALVLVATDRDKRAFKQLFEYFAPKIKRFGIKQFGGEAMALELVQDTMTSVWRKAHLYYPEKGAATTWVYTVMRNAAFDALRKIKNHREDQLSDAIWPMVDEAMQKSEDEEYGDHLLKNQIHKHLDKLPQAQRDVVTGVYFHDLSQEQLAVQLDIPVGTVKSRLRLALQKLRKEMGE